MTRRLFDEISRRSVAVVGDVMLDIYLHGAVTRISPEAPVPVLRWTSERTTLGGAANVAATVASLGLAVKLVGLVGDDGFRHELADRLAAFPTIDATGLVCDAQRATIRKTRIVGQMQQMLRIDREDQHPPAQAIEDELIARACAAIDCCDIAVLSDYGKGALTDRLLRTVLEHARACGKRVLVDPKRADYAAYKGASIVTPNRAELRAATGEPCETDEEAASAAARASALAGCDILLTRSEKGMSFFPRVGRPIHLPTMAKAVFDVSGAGDTVVAMLAACLAAELSMAEAMKVANHAAGIVVGKFGTAIPSREELIASIEAAHADDIRDGRLASLADAVALRRQWESAGYTVGVTNGCFDLLHPGHVALLTQAAESCDRLIVALNTDASVRRLKGAARPVQSEQARAQVIGAIKGVDLVVLFDEDTPHALISALQPDVLVKGADYLESEIVGADIVRARGGRIVRAELVDGQSTTKILERSK